MKLFGKIVSALLSLILITSIILWVLAKNINPETVKNLVNNQITALTHKKSRIDGTISWQLFPRPGLKFSKIIIGDEQISEEYSLSIETLHLNLKITPLLRGQFIFGEVSVDGLKAWINLNRPPELKPSEKSPDTNANTHNNMSAQFAIERLVVNHGELIFNKNGHNTVLTNLQIGSEQFNLQNAPFSVQIKTKLNEYDSNPQVKASINFNGRLSLAPGILNQLRSGTSQSSVDGQLLVQNVLLNKFAIKKISATIKTNKEGLQFNPLTFSLYNGESVGTMNYVLATHQLSLSQIATNLNGKELMAALVGQEIINGDLDYSIHATIPVEHISMKSIGGKGSVTVKDGEIYHLNLDQLLNSLREKLSHLTEGNKLDFSKLPQLADWDSTQYNQGNTPFKLASIQYQLGNGILDSESILIQTDKLQIKGKGTLNLSNHEINSTVQASLANNNSELSLQRIQQILGGYFPLIITGTLEQPRILPDFKSITPFIRQLLMKTSLEKPIDQIKNQLKGLIH